MIPGEVITGTEPIVANVGRRTARVRVHNTSRWPVHVSSHFHFFEANRRLEFDRTQAFGMRLSILAGATVRWEPGEVREVELVEFGGARGIYGFNGLVDGIASDETRDAAVRRARERGFLDRRA
jgi:urease beta subunit